ncbi:hypothetical protein [Bradyrhizobium sp.]|jgi:uncharacterized protein (DUF302 family)|uniref:hypothetical protein n=1 Tax=Bradyrhizobium sp. TaxID=376 RepID=UPI002E08C4DF|nr:hypothetical protein [Bradyrhizobium sp.]
MGHKTIVSCAILLALTAVAKAENPNDIFIVRTTSKTPDAIVAAIKSHSEQKKWEYLGESKIKRGEVTLVKICIPAVAQHIWPVGLQLSALLPCGNVGIYQKGTATEISVLHPRYMNVLYSHAGTERASAVAEPLLTEMLDVVTK